MERDPETASLYSAQGGSPERGAGGKLRRPPPRRPTPYSRPQQSQSQGSRWLSKLVDPARRFIAGGATRIFPYLFSKSTADDSLPAPTNETNENSDADVYQNASGDHFTFTPNFGVSKSTDVAKTNSIVEVSMTISGFEAQRQAEKSNLTDTNGLSEIEQLMRDKKFSRDEINHLIEIINSRAVDVPNVDQESKELGISGEEANRPIVSHQTPRKPAEEKNEDFSKALWGPSTPFHQSIIKDEIGASPIEIARAYMENRTSEIGLGATNIISDDGRPPLLSDDFSLKLYVPPSSSKPSACWPGATVQDQRGYVSSQSQRSRFGLHSFPRTPYSRAIFSKSKSKLAPVQAEVDNSLNNSGTPLMQSRTPLYRQLRGKAVDDGHGSVGPIRRIRIQHKVATETPRRGSVYSHSLSNGPSLLENSNVSKGIIPTIKKNLEPGEGSSSSLFLSVDRSKSRNSELGTPIVHPHSSQVARTILEHLDRNLPTPKDKSNELKLATSWRKSQSSDATTVMPKEDNSLSYFGGLDYSKRKDQLDKKASSQWNRDRGNLLPMSLLQNTVGSKDAVNRETSASDINVDDTVKLFSDNAEPSLNFWKAQDSQSMHKEFSTTVTNAAGSGSPQKPPSNSLGNKPILPSIAISKAVYGWTFSSDNSSGFSFPISAPSGASSEPPTPSIMPLVSATALPQSKEESAVPSFSFGSKRSTLVFSFPSSSSAPNHVDSSDIKFNFSSDRSKRISFASVVKDAVCY